MRLTTPGIILLLGGLLSACGSPPSASPACTGEATVEMGAEALLHIDGTPREAYIADVPLRFGGLGPDGHDPGYAAARDWLAATPTP
jgi:hypothetical protein